MTLNEYERQREARIAANKERLQALGVIEVCSCDDMLLVFIFSDCACVEEDRLKNQEVSRVPVVKSADV